MGDKSHLIISTIIVPHENYFVNIQKQISLKCNLMKNCIAMQAQELSKQN